MLPGRHGTIWSFKKVLLAGGFKFPHHPKKMIPLTSTGRLPMRAAAMRPCPGFSFSVRAPFLVGSRIVIGVAYLKSQEAGQQRAEAEKQPVPAL